MANHFSSLGFRVHDEETFTDFVELAMKHASSPKRKGMRALCWEVLPGLEVWMQADNTGEVVSCNIHYFGRTRLKGRVAGHLRAEEQDLDGALHLEVNPDGEAFDYPLIVDIPNFATVIHRADLAKVITVQVTAFSHGMEVFETEEAFLASQNDEVKLDAKSLVPTGAFNEEGPRPEAMISGKILVVEELKNPMTGDAFWHLEVETFGGCVDVVADPELVEGTPAVGAILHGSFWMSARIPDDN